MKRSVKYAVPLAAVAAAGINDVADAADLFLKIEPIKGESVDAVHAERLGLPGSVSSLAIQSRLAGADLLRCRLQLAVPAISIATNRMRHGCSRLGTS